MWRQLASSEKETKTDRMVAAQPTSQQSTGPAKRLGRKTHVVGSSAKKLIFRGRISHLSPGMHWGCTSVAYDFALGDEDDRISYTVAKPRKTAVCYYTSSNSLYSIAATTNTSGAVVERYSYNAYGVRTVKNSAGATLAKSAVNQDRGFTSYKLDPETGLYFARSRMYSAKLGRFVSRDIAMENVKRSVVKSFYSFYPYGNDLYAAYFIPNNTDPTGSTPGKPTTTCPVVKEDCGKALRTSLDKAKATYDSDCNDCATSEGIEYAAATAALLLAEFYAGGVNPAGYRAYALALAASTAKYIACVFKADKHQSKAVDEALEEYKVCLARGGTP